MLRETQLGWVVGGVCDEEEETAAVVHSHMAILENLNLKAGEAKIITENLKVDKAVFASDGIPQAFKESQLIQLCKTGGFELHKGSSDSPEAEREELVSVGGTEVKEVIKALDLLWNPTADKQPSRRCHLCELGGQRHRKCSHSSRASHPLWIQTLTSR
ncbi:uncharacterized protein LOC119770357 [Culex quinquefasciatus]|uniref:uncharacterized protein LOC119770357 n=1 Tax=Culex quinquefasciatus TaxID=7176 RepID=UPI0018E30742|nr:uncharacterized protein LOC119770357 [Culex quinquefasciatus]